MLQRQNSQGVSRRNVMLFNKKAVGWKRDSSRAVGLSHLFSLTYFVSRARFLGVMGRVFRMMQVNLGYGI
jgi:hypothetical protein